MYKLKSMTECLEIHKIIWTEAYEDGEKPNEIEYKGELFTTENIHDQRTTGNSILKIPHGLAAMCSFCTWNIAHKKDFPEFAPLSSNENACRACPGDFEIICDNKGSLWEGFRLRGSVEAKEIALQILNTPLKKWAQDMIRDESILECGNTAEMCEECTEIHECEIKP